MVGFGSPHIFHSDNYPEHCLVGGEDDGKQKQRDIATESYQATWKSWCGVRIAGTEVMAVGVMSIFSREWKQIFAITEKGKKHRNGWNYDSKTKMRQGYETKQDRVANTIRNKMEMQRRLQELYLLHR